MTLFDTAVASRTLAQEARGEPPAGQIAVAWTLRNRLATGRWGKSLASVCLWRAQFSGWYVPTDPNFAYACNLADDDPTLLKMQQVLASLLAADADTDPTNGAISYYAASLSPAPYWASSMYPRGQFGHQLFFADTPAHPPELSET